MFTPDYARRVRITQQCPQIQRSGRNTFCHNPVPVPGPFFLPQSTVIGLLARSTETFRGLESTTSEAPQATATRSWHAPRPRNIHQVQSSLSAERHVLVCDGPPVLVREGVSLPVEVFERTLYKENDLAVFLQHQRMHGAGRFVNDVTAPRDPIVFEIPPRAADCQPEDRPVMSMTSEIAASWPPAVSQSNGRWSDQPGLVALTSAPPVREPRRVVRGNIQRIKCSGLHPEPPIVQ
jgi:hypothetical protein